MSDEEPCLRCKGRGWSVLFHLREEDPRDDEGPRDDEFDDQFLVDTGEWSVDPPIR